MRIGSGETAGLSDSLHEREAELAALSAALAQAQAGTGRLVIIEGSAGIGKSCLLGAARVMATALGMAVLTARGTDLERDAPFGVATELLGGTVASASGEERGRLLAGQASLAAGLFDPSVPLADDPSALPRGLYRLTVNAAAGWPGDGDGRAGLLIAVDDAQWADRPSLSYLAYLAARIDELPAVLAVATRPAEQPGSRPAVDWLRDRPGGLLLRPRELSPQAVAQMVRAGFPGAGPAFSQACAEVTGGNPFLVTELVRALDAEGVTPDDGGVGRVRSLVPDSVLRSVLARLTRLGAPAGQLARAVAVLGEEVPLRRARMLAGLDAPTAERAADALAGARILAAGEPLRFWHSLIAASVYADIPSFARARAHRRAADLLAGDGVPSDGVAPHLMLSPSDGDQRTVAALREAANRALARGDSEAAAQLLARAVAEPPALAERGRLLLELANAEMEQGATSAGEHIDEALRLPGDLAFKVAGLAALGRLRFNRGEHEAAARTMEEALELLEPGTPGFAPMLASYLTATTFHVGLHPLAGPWLRPVVEAARDGRLPGDPGLLAHLTLRLALAGEPGSRIRAIAEAATAADPLVNPASLGMLPMLVIQALSLADELDAAERIATAAVAAARRRGSLLNFAGASYGRAVARYHQGELTGALADLDQSMVARREGWTAADPWIGALLVHIQLERGDLAAARDGLALTDGASPDSMNLPVALFARARLALAQGHPEAALTDAETAGHLLGTGFGIDHPGFIPWRQAAAVAAHALGRAGHARALAGELLESARGAGTARALGLALRTQAALVSGDQRLLLLAEAADALKQSPSALERARVLVELGAARRQAGNKTAAREPLREGLELADRMGAAPLVQAARRELHALGLRPRRSATTGLGSLTPTERRVAMLAASGLTNRQVAEALFVTVRTVETHLARVYQKLGISARSELVKVTGPLPREAGEEGEPA